MLSQLMCINASLKRVYEEYNTNTAWGNFTSDQLQESLIVLLDKYDLEQLSEKETLRLAYTICKNKQNTEFKKQKNRNNKLRENVHTLTQTLHCDPASPEEIELMIEEKVAMQKVYQCVAKEHGQDVRTVFMLYLDMTTSTKEIADTFNVSLRTVKRYIKKAKLTVARQFDIEEEDILKLLRTRKG